MSGGRRVEQGRGNSGRRAEKRRLPKGAPVAAVLLLFVLLLAVGGFRVAVLWREYGEGKNAYTQLYEQVQVTPSPMPVPVQLEAGEPIQTEQPIQTPPPWPQVDFEALGEINPDGVGWIVIPDTGIDYPIVQGEDNEAYLRKLFKGEENSAGCIFIDCGNSPDFSDKNNVVYGHHLKNGEMFSPLLNYKQQDYFDAHPTGWLVTPGGAYLIRFFSGFVSDVWGDGWDLTPSEDWAQDMAKKSLFQGGPSPKQNDRILTLSTCSYEFSNARFLLMGVMEKQG